MTLGAESAEVFRPPQTAAIQDSRTPSDRARRATAPDQLSHEIRRRKSTFSTPKPQHPNYLKM